MSAAVSSSIDVPKGTASVWWTEIFGDNPRQI
jgi:hypothetical protein